MNICAIIKCQWDGYTKYHQSAINLWIHIVFVPVFILGFLSFIATLIDLHIVGIAISILLMVTAIGIQGFGHNKEAIPAEPFTGPQNAIVRIILEQLYTFPKFVLSGKWYRALRSK